MLVADRKFAFEEHLSKQGLCLARKSPSILQINLGKLCNLACVHCHVNAGPGRKEIMDPATFDRVIDWIALSPSIETIDLTGGAPEMNPYFREFIVSVRAIRPEATIIDRCNLTILLESGYEDMAEFLALHRIQVVASMPCYQPKNVNLQRGEGVFDSSIEALKRLNTLAYGMRPELVLNLVYNPLGAVLPPDQEDLEKDFKTALRAEFGIEFNRLFTITNMPIARFLTQLRREGKNEMYRQLLVDNFNRASIDGLMCRDTISVDWEGRVFDCDFNQMLEMPLGGGQNRFLWELDADVLEREPIATGDHCFGCTAGAGSSCGGALDG